MRTVKLKYFGDFAKDIYDSTFLLKVCACSYKKGTFLELYTLVVDGKCINGICPKVDDFNFEEVNYPFPQSKINSMLDYTTFHSQSIRFFTLCNNLNDFLFRAKLKLFKVDETWLL